jgi:H+/Cl- antiporter ClcA
MAGTKSFADDSCATSPPPPRVLQLALMAAVAGSMGAGAAWCLLRLIAFFTNLAYWGKFSTAPASIPATLPVWCIFIPVIGSLVIGLMARYGSEKIRGHGIPEAIEAILIGRSRIQPKVALLKPLSSAISIGTVGPFGAEGPIIMTGGALGSLFAQLFHLTSAERKTLLVAGAAAGMNSGVRHADCRRAPGGGTALVRMEAAQLHPCHGRKPLSPSSGGRF